MSSRGLFICYRREDSQGEAGRIDDRLRPRYGSERVFRDVYSSPPGVDFPEYLVATVEGCAVVILVIGNQWLRSLRSQPDGTDDWLRLEIRTALRSPRVTVIPVLVQGAAMPRSDQLPADIRAIATITAHEISDSRWEYDMTRLLEVVDELVPPARLLARGARGPAARSQWTRTGAAAAALIGVTTFLCGIGVGLILVINVLGTPTVGNPPPDGPPHEGPPPDGPRGGLPGGPPGSVLWIQSVANDRCIQLGSGATASGVVEGACTAGSTDDQWRLMDAGAGLWEITPANGPGCLAVRDGSSEQDAPVVLTACASAPFLRWRLEEAAEHEWRLVAAHSQQCLDLAGGGQLVQSRCGTASASQRWRLQPIVSVDQSQGRQPPPQ